MVSEAEVLGRATGKDIVVVVVETLYSRNRSLEQYSDSSSCYCRFAVGIELLPTVQYVVNCRRVKWPETRCGVCPKLHATPDHVAPKLNIYKYLFTARQIQRDC